MTIATIIPGLTNSPPSRANIAAFPTDADQFLQDLPSIVTAENQVIQELNTWATEVETFKNQAATSETNSATSASTALTQARNAAASTVSLWVSGATYTAGQIVYSNVDGREYKRKTTGDGTTDPSSDTTNWEPLGWEYITNYPEIRPTLDLNFAGSQTVDPRITFTRNSIATYFDKFGVMQSAGVNQPRIDFDPSTGECKGLLIEEARTNVLLNSATLSNQSVTTTATAYTLSFYGTGAITRSGTSTGSLVGTSATDRVSVTFTPTAGILTLAVTGSVTNAQLEVGSFATSYIPTTSTAVTRQADVSLIQGVAFTDWFRQEEGTIYCESTAMSLTPSRVALSFNDGGSSNYMWLMHNNSTGTNSSYFQVFVSGVEQAGIGLGTPSDLLKRKACIRYKQNNFAISRDGNSVVTDTAGNVPTVNRLSIGNHISSTQMNGWISRITYYPKTFVGRVMRQISTP